MMNDRDRIMLTTAVALIVSGVRRYEDVAALSTRAALGRRVTHTRHKLSQRGSRVAAAANLITGTLILVNYAAKRRRRPSVGRPAATLRPGPDRPAVARP